MVVYKPAGLFVHRSAFNRRERGEVLLQKVRDQMGTWVTPVHRLDRPTAGLCLFAFDSEAASALQKQFAERDVQKLYLALTRGFMAEQVALDYAVKDERGVAQSAQTTFHCLGVAEVEGPVGKYATARYSLVQALPHTGRYHQIRRHLVHLRHPILGDSVHGDGKQNRFFRERFGVQRLMLVAAGLSFRSPDGDRPVRVTTVPDDEWSGVLSALDDSTKGAAKGLVHAATQAIDGWVAGDNTETAPAKDPD